MPEQPPYRYGSFRKRTEDGYEILSDYMDEGDVLWDGESNDLPVPHNLHVVEKTPGTITVGWSSSESARVDGFAVYVNGEKKATADSSPYTITGLNALTKYRIYVASVGDGAESSSSNIISVTTPTGERPKAPVDVYTYAGDGKIGVEWADADDQVDGVDYYTATAYAYGAGSTEALASSYSLPGQKRAIITGVDNSTSYTVRVKAHSGYGQGFSPESGDSAQVVPRPAPSITSVDPAAGLDGTMVTIHGSNFVGERPGETGAIDVTFGGVPASSVVVIDDTEIQCQANATTETVANSNGKVDVEVVIQPTEWPDRTGVLPSGFTFIS